MTNFAEFIDNVGAATWLSIFSSIGAVVSGGYAIMQGRAASAQVKLSQEQTDEAKKQTELMRKALENEERWRSEQREAGRLRIHLEGQICKPTSDAAKSYLYVNVHNTSALDAYVSKHEIEFADGTRYDQVNIEDEAGAPITERPIRVSQGRRVLIKFEKRQHESQWKGNLLRVVITANDKEFDLQETSIKGIVS